MAKQRRYFGAWVKSLEEASWVNMPLTHVTTTIVARDIIHDGEVTPSYCEVAKDDLVYTFYGRPGYRVGAEGTVPLEAFCPVCFIFNGALLDEAKSVIPFDTGAYKRRLYKFHEGDKINFDDFSIAEDCSLPNRLIRAIYKERLAYVNGDRSKIPPVDQLCTPSQLEARVYLSLIRSDGRNEPDDRVASIEVAFGKQLRLRSNLKGMIIPHTLWSDDHQSDWVAPLLSAGIDVRTYEFVPGKPPDHYHALLEVAFKQLLAEWGEL